MITSPYHYIDESRLFNFFQNPVAPRRASFIHWKQSMAKVDSTVS